MANLKKEVPDGIISQPRLFSILVNRINYESFIDYLQSLKPPFRFTFTSGGVYSSLTWSENPSAIYMQCYRGGRLFTVDSHRFSILDTKLPIFWSEKCLSFIKDIESS